LYQALRLPEKGNEPKEPALTLPDSLSPSTVPVKSKVSGRGLVILADQLTALPSTLLCCLGTGQAVAVGGNFQTGLLRAQGRIDDDFPFSIHGHAVLPADKARI
jgi:hypothetical protein